MDIKNKTMNTQEIIKNCLKEWAKFNPKYEGDKNNKKALKMLQDFAESKKLPDYDEMRDLQVKLCQSAEATVDSLKYNKRKESKIKKALSSLLTLIGGEIAVNDGTLIEWDGDATNLPVRYFTADWYHYMGKNNPH